MKSHKRKVLLTGAAGKIGTGFREEYIKNYKDYYELWLAVREPDFRDDRFDNIAVFDLVNFEKVKKACEGVDVIVHLAANPHANGDFHKDLLQPNIIGAYNLFEAAKEMGCKRVIFASTVHVVMGYPEEYQVRHDEPARPDTPYAVTKIFSEALCSMYAYMHGMSCIAIRIGGYVPDKERVHIGRDGGPGYLCTVISQRDLCQLIHKCIIAPMDIKYAVVNGLSDNREKRLDIEYAKELLGYQPQDDAFKWKEDYGKV